MGLVRAKRFASLLGGDISLKSVQGYGTITSFKFFVVAGTSSREEVALLRTRTFAAAPPSTVVPLVLSAGTRGNYCSRLVGDVLFQLQLPYRGYARQADPRLLRSRNRSLLSWSICEEKHVLIVWDVGHIWT